MAASGYHHGVRVIEINGGVRLHDGSWLYFGMHHSGGKWAFTIGRMGLALIPVVALLLAGLLLIRRTLAPLRDLTHATHRIGRGSEVIVPEAGTNDVRNLITAFNAMQARIHRLINERTETLAAVVRAHDAWELTALHDLVTISGSLVLGLAVSHGRLGAGEAWDLSRIDEAWNIREWGEDAEAADAAERRRAGFTNAARLMALLRQA